MELQFRPYTLNELLRRQDSQLAKLICLILTLRFEKQHNDRGRSAIVRIVTGSSFGIDYKPAGGIAYTRKCIPSERDDTLTSALPFDPVPLPVCACMVGSQMLHHLRYKLRPHGIFYRPSNVSRTWYTPRCKLWIR